MGQDGKLRLEKRLRSLLESL